MVERRFPKDVASLGAIYGFVREFLAERGIGPEAAYDVDLIAEELFTNMVKYGRGGESEISIALDWSAPTLTFCIRDFGAERFDPTEAPEVDTTRPIEERRAGGLGIHLVRRIADHLSYAYDQGNTIRIMKRLET